jgi:predicted RNA polymerase sigma factor
MIIGTEPAPMRRREAARLAAIRREAESLAAQTAVDLRTVYAVLGSKIAEALEAAAEIDQKIRRANEALRESGVTDLVPSVADRVALRSEGGITLDLFGSTSLAPVSGPGWGQARLQAERLGLVVTK